MAITAFIVARGIQKGIEVCQQDHDACAIHHSDMHYHLQPDLAERDGWCTFYLIPDFAELKIQTVFEGLKQAFFSLSLGMGTLMTYGSYLKKNENITSSAAVISIADTSVAFLAGLMVFPLVHFLQ